MLEQLAVYHGVQTANVTDRSVKFYAAEFLSAGGMLSHTLNKEYAETKDFRVMHHLGNVRQVIRTENNVVVDLIRMDYKPFGDTINADESQRLDFIDRERDFENGYIAMGARNYDPKLGRFLSCDPLMESFPAQSPYNYAYNSPMQWKDPSGQIKLYLFISILQR